MDHLARLIEEDHDRLERGLIDLARLMGTLADGQPAPVQINGFAFKLGMLEGAQLFQDFRELGWEKARLKSQQRIAETILEWRERQTPVSAPDRIGPDWDEPTPPAVNAAAPHPEGD